MADNDDPENPPPQVEFVIAVSLRAPIAAGRYNIGQSVVEVSYPRQVNLGFPTPIDLPRGLSTLFIVSWSDKKSRTIARLRSKGFDPKWPGVTFSCVAARRLELEGEAESQTTHYRSLTVGGQGLLFSFSIK